MVQRWICNFRKKKKNKKNKTETQILSIQNCSVLKCLPPCPVLRKAEKKSLKVRPLSIWSYDRKFHNTCPGTHDLLRLFHPVYHVYEAFDSRVNYARLLFMNLQKHLTIFITLRCWRNYRKKGCHQLVSWILARSQTTTSPGERQVTS